MKNFLKRIFKWNTDDIKDDVNYVNEVETNTLIAFLLLLASISLIFIHVLRYLQIFSYNHIPGDFIIWSTFALQLSAFVLTVILKGRSHVLKYILLVVLYITNTAYVIFLGIVGYILAVLPLIISSRYNKKWLTLISSLAGLVIVYISIYATYFITGEISYDALTPSQILNFLFNDEIDYGNYAYLITTTVTVPFTLIYLLIALACYVITTSGYKKLMKEKEKIEQDSKMEGELELAKNIQKNMLPKKLEDEDNLGNYEVSAIMYPAKEVGGDFYDYFLVDESHICVLIADVSGKGVPAGMFMAKAKALIKLTMLEHSISDTFAIVNNSLYEGNEDGLFITAWLGILSLDTGVLNYTNAGHGCPFVITNKEIVKLKQEPNFVLAGKENITFDSFEYKMKEGDTLVLYTDGVTEAMNKERKLYGEERFVELLKKNKDASIEVLLKNIKESVDQYSVGLDQTDDITSLALRFNKKQKNIISKEFDATTNNVKEVLEYTDDSLNKLGIKQEDHAKIKIIVEEIYLNIASYAYKYKTGKAYLGFKLVDKDSVQITFKDQGSPFNPLKYAKPDIDKPLEDRKVGGLGIHMVINLADDIKYRYDGSNILVVMKKVNEK